MAQKESLLKKSTRVSIKDEYIVVGYIRNESMTDIPDGIVQICILFFVCVEQWSQQYKGDRITINGNVATIKMGSEGEQGLQSIVGRNVIRECGIHHWRFKILQIKSIFVNIPCLWKLVIGIVNVDNVNDETLKKQMETYLSAGDSKVYIYITAWGSRAKRQYKHSKGKKVKTDDRGKARSVPYGIQCLDNDVIDMYLDLNKGKLAFCVNNEYQDIAFKNIRGKEWRMGASMSGRSTSLQLVSYQQLNEFPY